MDSNNQAIVLPEDRRLYMEIKTRIERDQEIHSNLRNIMTRYEGIKPRTKERITNITELILELEQRCYIR